MEVDVDDEDEDEFATSFLHLLYAGEPNAGSCPVTSYISLLAKVRPDRGRLFVEAGARTAGVESGLQHAEGALDLASLASSSIADDDPSCDDVIGAAAAAATKLLLLMLRL